MKITTIGLDLAKSVFHVVACNQAGKVEQKKKLRRGQLLLYFTQLEPCLVGMEGCASAHHWAREFEKLGHTVRLIPAQHVKAYLRGNKNDYNDALAIAEAVVRPEMRFLAIKTQAQQDVQALHRLRESQIKMRTSLCNRVRGLLAEFGIILTKGVSVIRRSLPDILEDAENGLSDLFRQMLLQSQRQFLELDEHIAYYDKLIQVQSQSNDACQRLQAIPGFGPIVSSVFVSYVGDGQGYRRGRDVSASLGLVPMQHSSGGKDQLLGISKRGDRYLRCLLVHGARAAVRAAAKKDDNLSRWINRIRDKRGIHKATVALANKLARIGWAILYYKTEYQSA